jgi:hypothetical protein
MRSSSLYLFPSAHKTKTKRVLPRNFSESVVPCGIVHSLYLFPDLSFSQQPYCDNLFCRTRQQPLSVLHKAVDIFFA